MPIQKEIPFQHHRVPPVLRRVSAELSHGAERRPLRRGGGGQVRGGARGQRHQGQRGAGRAGTRWTPQQSILLICSISPDLLFKEVNLQNFWPLHVQTSFVVLMVLRTGSESQ